MSVYLSGLNSSFDGTFIIGISRPDFSPLNSAIKLPSYFLMDYGLAQVPTFYQSTYSLQQAIKPIEARYDKAGPQYGDYGMYLFTDECDKNNCTRSCLDPDFVFSSPNALHNCISYQLVAKFYSDGNISASTNDSALLDTLDIQKSPQGSEPLTRMGGIIQQCLQSHCNESLDCKSSVDSTRQISIFNTTGAFFFEDDDYETPISGQTPSFNDGYSSGYTPSYNDRYTSLAEIVCATQLAGLNSDIGGIGVFISYWIQCGLAVVGCLAVFWWRWGIRYYRCFTHRHGSRRVARRDYSPREAIAFGDKHLATTCSALTEFQKAQCFFMLAINIAAQVNRGRGGFQPTSLQQLYNNYRLIKTVSISGFLPITFTMFTLHTVDLISWYLIILSILTVAFSTATLVDIGNFTPSERDLDYLSQQALIGGPAACNNRNILVYCLDTISSQTSTSGGYGDGPYSMLGFCLTVLLLLVLKQANLFTKLSNLQTKPFRSKIYNFLISNFVGIRGMQLGLVMLSCIFEALLDQSPLLPFIELLSLVYVFIASDLKYSARKTVVGKIYNKWGLLFVEVLAFATSFSDFLIRLIITQHNNIYSGVIIALMTLLCFSFTFTLVSTSIHVHRARKSQAQGKIIRRRRPILLPQLSAMFSPAWRAVRSGFPNARPSTFASSKSNSKRNIKSAMSINDSTPKLATRIIVLVYVAFFGIYVYWFVLYFSDLSSFGYFVDFDAWSFGQVVAITVWAQPLCEYFHLELRGIQCGFQHRLIWPYRVVVATQENEDEYDAEKAEKAPAIVVEAPALADEITADTTTTMTTVAHDTSQELLLRERADSVAQSTTSSTPLVRVASSESSPEGNYTTVTGEEGDISAETYYHETYDPQEDVVELTSLSNEPRAPSSSSSSLSHHIQDHDHTNWQIPESVLKTSGDMTF